jgi:hypothetical protein
MNLPDINGEYLSTRKIQSKFAKKKSKLQDRVMRDIPIVTLDRLKIKELHELIQNFRAQLWPYSIEIQRGSPKRY